MRPVSKDFKRRKLEKSLRQARLRDLLIMVWAMNSVRKGDVEAVRKYLSVPDDAAAATVGNAFFIQPWTLETLVNEALTKPTATSEKRKLFLTQKWHVAAEIYNRLHQLENVESLEDIPEG